MSLSFKVDILERAKAEPYGRLYKDCPHGLPQQSLEWADVIAPISPDKPYFLVARQNGHQTVAAGLPLFHYEGELGGILTSVPHAGPMGGVLCRSDLSGHQRKEVCAALMDIAIQLAEEMQCISLSVITNPFVEDAEFYKSIAPEYTLNNFCQVVDLKTILDDAGAHKTGKSSYNSLIRRNIQKAVSNGVTVEWGDERDFDVWYEIHCQRHGEIGAPPLPKPLLKGIMNVLEPAGHGGLVIARIKDQIVGGGVYIWNKDVVDVYMPSYQTESLKYGVNYAVNDFALRHFSKAGMTWFNFQSSNRDSGVYEFKKRWGSKDHHYQILTWSFKGFERVLEEPLENVSNMYRWHYVAPFQAIEKRLSRGFFDKATAKADV